MYRMLGMKSNFQKVLDFCRCAGHPVYGSLQGDIFDKSPDRVKLRLGLISEEYNELLDAVRTLNFTEVIDALTDILYVTYGAGAEFGIDLDKTFRHLHKIRISYYNKNNNADIVYQGDLSNFLQMIEFNKLVGYSVYGIEQRDIFTVRPKIVQSQLKLIKTKLELLVDSIGDKDLLGVGFGLTSLLYAVYETGIEFGIHLDKTFEIVHNSNMTKFCSSELEAADTVKWYQKQLAENILKYKSPCYRKSADGIHWVVYDSDTDKALKSINYTPAKFD